MHVDNKPAGDASLKSSFIEQLVEHVFISEVLQEVWYSHKLTIEVLRSEVDSSGYDIVLDCNSIVRHVQLKTSHEDAKTARQKVGLVLESKPSGCVVWIIRTEDKKRQRMNLSYRFFGGEPGAPLPSLMDFPIAKHSKGNAQGFKAERKGLRVVPIRYFKGPFNMAKLVELLFDLPQVERQAKP